MLIPLLCNASFGGSPIRVGMVGAGATGRAIALQLGTPVPGMRLVAIANRTPEHGERAFREGGFQEWRRVTSARAAEAAINRGIPVLTDDPSVLTTCPAIDILLEVTGTVEAAAGVVLQAFDQGEHVVLANAELDYWWDRFSRHGRTVPEWWSRTRTAMSRGWP